MPYKVLYISNGVTLGGAEQSLIDTLKMIKERGVTPIVIIPNQGIIETKLKELKIVYYIVSFNNGYGKIGSSTKLKEDTNFYNNFEAALRLQEIIKKEKVDLIHINSSVSNVGAFAALMAGIPYVWHFREFLEEDFSSEFFDKNLKKELVCCADALIAISDTVAKSYWIKYGFHLTKIYNGIDSERYKNEITLVKEDNNKIHNFLITGVITENKGQWDAIKAIKYLVDKGITNLHLTIIGNGREDYLWILNKYIMKNNLQSYIDIIPFQKDLSPYRKDAQYSITTSKMEALGRCTIEAMFAGNIVIGADTGGTKEIIGEDETRGYLYKEGDYLSLAKVINKVILEKKEKKIDCIKNAQRFVEETFSLERYADSIYKIYDDVMHKEVVNNDKRTDLREELNKRFEHLDKTISIEKKEKNEYEVICEGWEKIAEKGHKIYNYLLKHNYKKIAIYGIGNLGIKAYREIEESCIEVSYVVDKNPRYLKEIFNVIHPEDDFPDVDLLLITVAKEESQLVKRYQNKYKFPVIGISEIINELKGEEYE